MSVRGMRHSKFRHVFGTPNKAEFCYNNVKITKSPFESNMCAVNSKFVAVVLEAQGGGAFLVINQENVGRVDLNHPKVCGHKSGVMDIQWNPFNEHQIASCSEDCKVMVWDIPEGGMTENIDTASVTLVGHERKCAHLQWHPTASNVLASSAYDNVIIIWDTSVGESLITLDCFPDTISYFDWNYNGSFIAATCKDKKLRVISPRSGDVVAEGTCHLGNKPSKVVWCGKLGYLCTTGFTRTAERQIAVWDKGDLTKPLAQESLDNASGVLFPFYDEGTSMVYITGKGDTNVRFFEVISEPPYLQFLNLYQSTVSQRGMGVLPKRCVDYKQCEVMRFYKLDNKGSVVPLVMTVPRKSVQFQKDLYPPAHAGEPSLTAGEWMSGQDCDPVMVEFTEDGLKKIAGGAKSSSATAKVKSSGATSKEPQTLEEFKKAYHLLQEENAQLKKELKQLKGQ